MERRFKAAVAIVGRKVASEQALQRTFEALRPGLPAAQAPPLPESQPGGKSGHPEAARASQAKAPAKASGPSWAVMRQSGSRAVPDSPVIFCFLQAEATAAESKLSLAFGPVYYVERREYR